MALNALLGGNNKQSSSSGSGNLVGTLAGSLLGGGKQSNSNSGSGSGNLVGQLAGSFLGGGKQNNSNQNQNSGSHSSSNQSSGGLGGLLGKLGGSVSIPLALNLIDVGKELADNIYTEQALRQRLRLLAQLCLQQHIHRHRTADLIQALQPGQPELVKLRIFCARRIRPKRPPEPASAA